MFFASFPQDPGSLSYILLITCYVGTLVTVDDSTFLLSGVLVRTTNDLVITDVIDDVISTPKCYISMSIEFYDIQLS